MPFTEMTGVHERVKQNPHIPATDFPTWQIPALVLKFPPQTLEGPWVTHGKLTDSSSEVSVQWCAFTEDVKGKQIKQKLLL